MIEVACGVEGERYVHHCATMLQSLLSRHSPGEVAVHYLHGADTTSRGRRRLGRMVDRLGAEIRFQEVSDAWVRGLPIADFTRKATWYRILLDELLPDTGRALWLDVDLLINQPLHALWEVDLAGSVLGAVTNVPPGPDRAYGERPELGGDPYFNAGVLLFDLATVRREKIGAELRAYAVEHADRLRWRDQDVLNEVLHHRRLPLDPRWNCMNSIMLFDYAADYFSSAALQVARRDPAIRHFEGPDENKPWHLLADRSNRAQYRRHRRRTPWPLLVPEGCTPSGAARYLRRRIV